MSSRMAAIVGLLLDRSCTEPVLAELIITPDGAVLGRLEGEPSTRVFIGAEADLRANLRRLGMAAGLDETEWVAFRECVQVRLVLALEQ